MHKSRLAGFIIDCKTKDLEGAARFWSNALGIAVKPPADEGSTVYRTLATDPNDLHVEVQQVEHESRVHLDIETDDIDAEAKRLQALGAKPIERIRTWLVMEAPTGQRFCLVRPQRADFDENANTWDDK